METWLIVLLILIYTLIGQLLAVVLIGRGRSKGASIFVSLIWPIVLAFSLILDFIGFWDDKMKEEDE